MKKKNINTRTTLVASIATLVVIALAILLWAIYGRTDAHDPQPTTHNPQPTTNNPQPTTHNPITTIAVMPTMDCLPILVAYNDSDNNRMRNDFRLQLFTAQMDLDTALIGGSSQIGFTDVVRAQRMIRKRTPIDFYSSTNLEWKLIANSKTRIRQVSNLEEKLVGISRFSAADMLSEKSIEDAGVKKEKVFRVQINDFGIRLRMFLNNELDAVMLPEPYSTEAVRFKNKVIDDYHDQRLHLGAIVVRTDMMSKKEKQLNRFTQLYNAAVDSINKNGVQHYREVIRTYCHIKAATIDSLHLPSYRHITPVETSTIEQAQQWLDKH